MLRKVLLSLLLTQLILLSNLVQAATLKTVQAYLVPPQVSQEVELHLTVQPATTIPKDGSFSYVFPKSHDAKIRPQGECFLQQPPLMVQAKCVYSISKDDRLVITVSNFSQPLTKFHQLIMGKFPSPRSTTPSSTFEYRSFNGRGHLLDSQLIAIYMQASIIDAIHVLNFASTSQEVAAVNQMLITQFQAVQPMLPTDQIILSIPKWNLKGSEPESMIEDFEGLKCAGVNSMISPSLCIAKEGKEFDQVIIEEAFIDNVYSGETLAFQIGPFHNPISGAVQHNFNLTVVDKDGGKIMGGASVLIVSEYSQVSAGNASIKIETTQVSLHTEIELKAFFPMPLDTGCRVKIVIPKSVGFDEQLTEVSAFGIFGYVRNAQFIVNAQNRTIELLGTTCKFYESNQNPAVIRIKNLINPRTSGPSESFKIIVNDASNNPIVMAQQNLSISAIPGQVQFGQFSVDNNVVQASTDIYMQFKPLNPISGNAQVRIDLPSDVSVLQTQGTSNNIPDGGCQIVEQNFVVSVRTSCIFIEGKTIIFKDMFFKEYRGGNQFQLREIDTMAQVKITGFKMPESVAPVGNFTITILDNPDEFSSYMYPVTQSQKGQLVQAEYGLLESGYIQATYDRTYFVTTLKMVLILNNPIEVNGTIWVQFPDDIEMFADAKCTRLTVRQSYCAYKGNQTLELIDFFLRGPGETGQKIIMTFAGIRTPRASRQSGYFKVETRDANGYLIDRLDTIFLPALKPYHKFSNVQLALDSQIVASPANMTFNFTVSVPLKSQDYMIIQFPNDLGQRLGVSYKSCNSSLDITCSLIGLDSLKIKSDSFGNKIKKGTILTIQVNDVYTPVSTKVSDALNITIYDQDGYVVVVNGADQKEQDIVRFHATQPSQMIYGSLVQHSKEPSHPTVYDFEIITKNSIPAQGKIIVNLPYGPKIDEFNTQCYMTSPTTQGVPCYYNKFDRVHPNSFILANISNSSILGGSLIAFEIDGIINPAKQSLSGQSVTLWTADDQLNLIDTKSDGLIVQTLCDYPCKTCMPDDPTKCTTCNIGASFPNYFHGKCVDECPQSFFNRDNHCTACSLGCLECDGDDNKCTKCNQGFYILGNTCYNECPDKFFSDWKDSKCQPCEKPCHTCYNATNVCTSCDQRDKLSYYFDYNCHTECPKDISISSQGLCYACDQNCETCEATVDTCTSCANGFALDLTNNKCTQTCTPDVSVFYKFDFIEEKKNEYGQKSFCEPCDSSCATCDSKDKNQCTKCRQGYKFDERSGKCLDKCPYKTAELYIPLTKDHLCVECDEGCAECTYQADHCQACEDNWLYLDSSCLKECPVDYAVDLSNLKNCVARVEICKFGFKYNFDTQNCTLDVPHCRKGYILNSKDDMCIPEPKEHFPGVLIILVIVWIFFILIKKSKSKNLTQNEVVLQLLVGFSTMQQISIILMLIFSFNLQYQLVINLMIFACSAALIMNIFASMFFYVLFKQDKVFQHWAATFPDAVTFIQVAGLLFNFKLIRLLVCKFWELRAFDAIYEDKFRIYQRPLAVFNFVQTCLVAIPVTYASVWMVVQIPFWAYEIRSLGIEVTLLQLIISILEIKEFVTVLKQEKDLPMMRDLIKKPRSKIKPAKIRFMSAVDDGDHSYNMATSLDKTALENTICHSQVELLDHIVKHATQKSNLKMLDNSAEETFLPENPKEAKKIFNESRKGFELNKKLRVQAANIGKIVPLQATYCIAQPQSSEVKPKGVQRISVEPTQEILAKVGKNFKQSIKRADLKDKVDLYDFNSEGEDERDAYNFQLHYAEQEAICDKKYRANRRRTRSFDENVMREMYDDFQAESDFESQLSWVSFPLRPAYHKDPYMMARTALFGEKLKAKFQFNNVTADQHCEAKPKTLYDLVAVRTQTITKQLLAGIGKDPFDSDSEGSEIQKSDGYSILDPTIHEDIFKQIYHLDRFEMNLDKEEEGNSDEDSANRINSKIGGSSADVLAGLESQQNNSQSSILVDQSRSQDEFNGKHGQSRHSQYSKKSVANSKKKIKNIKKSSHQVYPNTEVEYASQNLETSNHKQNKNIDTNTLAVPEEQESSQHQIVKIKSVKDRAKNKSKRSSQNHGDSQDQILSSVAGYDTQDQVRTHGYTSKADQTHFLNQDHESDVSSQLDIQSQEDQDEDFISNRKAHSDRENQQMGSKGQNTTMQKRKFTLARDQTNYQDSHIYDLRWPQRQEPNQLRPVPAFLSKELPPFKSQKNKQKEEMQKPTVLRKQFNQFQKIRNLESKYLRGASKKPILYDQVQACSKFKKQQFSEDNTTQIQSKKATTSQSLNSKQSPEKIDQQNQQLMQQHRNEVTLEQTIAVGLENTNKVDFGVVQPNSGLDQRKSQQSSITNGSKMVDDMNVMLERMDQRRQKGDSSSKKDSPNSKLGDKKFNKD